MCSVDDPSSSLDDDDAPVVRPSAEELLRPPQRDLPCPEPGCLRRLPQPSALRFHLLKRHGRRLADEPPRPPRTAVFVCPQHDCGSSDGARKSQFPSLKALKQHYLKVHAPRTLVCPECRTAAFASEALLRAHWRLCGVSYRCDCGAQYSNVKLLKQHAVKHGHAILVAARPPAVPRSDKLRRLAPKPSPDALHLLASIALAGVPARAARRVTTCDAGTQTAAKRASRGGRSSGTQTRLTSVTTAEATPVPSQPPRPQGRAVGSQHVTVAAASAASQAGPSLVWGLVLPAPAGLISCQTQTEERETVGVNGGAGEGLQEGQVKVQPLEELLWGSREVEQKMPSQETQKPLSSAASGATSRRPIPQASVPAASPPPPMFECQTETDMLSAETQTHDSYDAIKHLLRSEDEQLLFPELSELSGTDIQTQTPWLTGDSETQTPWWTDDLMASPTQPAPVTNMETQTCLLCLGPCDCWGD